MPQLSAASARRLARLLGATTILPGALAMSHPSVAHASGSPERVVVRAVAGQDAAVRDAILAAGGTVQAHMGLIDAYAATVPSGAIGTLGARTDVAELTPDPTLHLQSSGGYDPTADPGSWYETTLSTGAQTMWRAGATGQGIGVALVDTGVAPVDGLTAPGKVVIGPDISFDSSNPQLYGLDGYGHGTHLAGIIGGRDSETPAGDYAGNSTNFIGMAPDAHIVSVKVADSAGATDVSQVIAGIDWVVEHRNDGGLNIRVLNLSFGTDSYQPYALDPLAFAAEQAWKHGIVVVVSAGNKGGDQRVRGMLDPAYDPYVIAVGASDETVSPATVSDISRPGDGIRNPDVVAPGAHIVSLRDPGSYADRCCSSTGAVGDRFFRGTGTSQATAVTSGAAALLLSHDPSLTPDEVKYLLTSTAQPLLNQPRAAQGAGEIDLGAALATRITPAFAEASEQRWISSTGLGLLELSRGSVHIWHNGVELTGEQDVQGRPVSTALLALDEALGMSWSLPWSSGGWASGGWASGGWASGGWASGGWASGGWASGGWASGGWASGGWASGGWASGGWASGGWASGGWASGGWASGGWASGGWASGGWADAGWS